MAYRSSIRNDIYGSELCANCQKPATEHNPPLARLFECNCHRRKYGSRECQNYDWVCHNYCDHCVDPAARYASTAHKVEAAAGLRAKAAELRAKAEAAAIEAEVLEAEAAAWANAKIPSRDDAEDTLWQELRERNQATDIKPFDFKELASFLIPNSRACAQAIDGGGLFQLATLKICRKTISGLPDSFRYLRNLREVGLDCQLDRLPEGILALAQLEKLDLSTNKLTQLPEKIGKLGSLRIINLANNNLTTLPKGIGQLTALQELHLNHNQLTTLSETMGCLTELNVLRVDHNPALRRLPDSLSNCQHLFPFVINIRGTGIQEGNLTFLRAASLELARAASLAGNNSLTLTTI